MDDEIMPKISTLKKDLRNQIDKENILIFYYQSKITYVSNKLTETQYSDL